MLTIGRALMTNPEVLILDEATEGLAPLVVREIWRIVGEIRQSGIASLIVDRNDRLVLAHTDRALVLEKGAVVLEGWSASLAQRPGVLGRHLGVTQSRFRTSSRRSNQRGSETSFVVGLPALETSSPETRL